MEGSNSIEFDPKLLESQILNLECRLSSTSGNAVNEGMDNFNSLRNIYIAYNSLLRINNLKWAQRARLMWATMEI